jgi:hypothetical protein
MQMQLFLHNYSLNFPVLWMERCGLHCLRVLMLQYKYKTQLCWGRSEADMKKTLGKISDSQGDQYECVFWDVAPCDLVNIDWHFWDADCLHNQGNLLLAEHPKLMYGLRCSSGLCKQNVEDSVKGCVLMVGYYWRVVDSLFIQRRVINCIAFNPLATYIQLTCWNLKHATRIIFYTWWKT